MKRNCKLAVGFVLAIAVAALPAASIASAADAQISVKGYIGNSGGSGREPPEEEDIVWVVTDPPIRESEPPATPSESGHIPETEAPELPLEEEKGEEPAEEEEKPERTDSSADVSPNADADPSANPSAEPLEMEVSSEAAAEDDDPSLYSLGDDDMGRGTGKYSGSDKVDNPKTGQNAADTAELKAIGGLLFLLALTMTLLVRDKRYKTAKQKQT